MNRTLALSLAALVVVALAVLSGAWLWNSYQDAQERAEDATKTVAQLRAQLDSTEAGVVTVTQYVDRVRTIEVKGDTIVKEIPRYVTPQADASCTIPVGFVRLHDAAAAGAVLDQDSRGADAASSGLALSAVAATVAGNYTSAHADAAQLDELQALLRRQGAVIIAEPAP